MGVIFTTLASCSGYAYICPIPPHQALISKPHCFLPPSWSQPIFFHSKAPACAQLRPPFIIYHSSFIINNICYENHPFHFPPHPGPSCLHPIHLRPRPQHHHRRPGAKLRRLQGPALPAAPAHHFRTNELPQSLPLHPRRHHQLCQK